MPHGPLLTELADAIVGKGDTEITRARDALAQALGAEAALDAIAVAANFERMVRIADPTGIPLGDVLESASAEVREQLALSRPPGEAG